LASRLVGVASIIAGLVLVSGSTFAGDSQVWLGDLVFTVPAVMWGLFTILARQWHVDPVRGTAMVWVLALAYLPGYLLVFGLRVLDARATEIVGQGLYQGVGVAIAALMLYGYAIRVLGSSTGSLFMPLVPVLSVLLAIPVLAETPTTTQVVGMIGVSVGMALASRQ
jgi:drug/metabolite transporter (DMT)-like permease